MPRESKLLDLGGDQEGLARCSPAGPLTGTPGPAGNSFWSSAAAGWQATRGTSHRAAQTTMAISATDQMGVHRHFLRCRSGIKLALTVRVRLCPPCFPLFHSWPTHRCEEPGLGRPQLQLVARPDICRSECFFSSGL